MSVAIPSLPLRRPIDTSFSRYKATTVCSKPNSVFSETRDMTASRTNPFSIRTTARTKASEAVSEVRSPFLATITSQASAQRPLTSMKGTRRKGDVAALNVVAMVLIAYIARLDAEEAFGRHDRIHRGAVDRGAGLLARARV